MAGKINFSQFSDPTPKDTNLYLVGYSDSIDNLNRYERKVKLDGIKFLGDQIYVKDTDGLYHKISISGNKEDGYYIEIDDPIELS